MVEWPGDHTKVIGVLPIHMLRGIFSAVIFSLYLKSNYLTTKYEKMWTLLIF